MRINKSTVLPRTNMKRNELDDDFIVANELLALPRQAEIGNSDSGENKTRNIIGDDDRERLNAKIFYVSV